MKRDRWRQNLYDIRAGRQGVSCSSGKVLHETREDAETSLVAMRQFIGGESLRVYECGECSKFHVGRVGRRGMASSR